MSNIESMEISHRIYKMAKECPVSGNDSNALIEYHGLVKKNGQGFWDNYKDKKVLDVCGGVSDFTAKLLQLGVDAYALDFGYDDIEELFIRSSHRPAGLFPKSVIENRNRYIMGSAHHLPFPSDTFDAVTSYYGIFGVIDDDVSLAYASINEGIRVLKPGGILSIGPFKSGDITKRQAKAEEEILNRLDDRRDIKFEVKNPDRKPLIGKQDISRMGKLTIVKFSQT
jgi:ubiquinone/menaquinone biosynthesis C-methylase UbiE